MHLLIAEIEDEENGAILLSFIETPGFGDKLDNTAW
jgi:septin family protein